MVRKHYASFGQNTTRSFLARTGVCTGNPDRQLCRQTLFAENPPNPGQNADKYCRQILQTNFVCRRSAENWAKMQTSPADKLCQQFLQTKFVCTGNPDRQILQTNFVCRKSAENWPKCRQILQTNVVCKKSAENWAKMQTNPTDKPCQDRKLQAAAGKCRPSLCTIFRQGLSILDKLCLYPKILELALGACKKNGDTGKKVRPPKWYLGVSH